MMRDRSWESFITTVGGLKCVYQSTSADCLCLFVCKYRKRCADNCTKWMSERQCKHKKCCVFACTWISPVTCNCAGFLRKTSVQGFNSKFSPGLSAKETTVFEEQKWNLLVDAKKKKGACKSVFREHELWFKFICRVAEEPSQWLHLFRGLWNVICCLDVLKRWWQKVHRSIKVDLWWMI